MGFRLRRRLALIALCVGIFPAMTCPIAAASPPPAAVGAPPLLWPPLTPPLVVEAPFLPPPTRYSPGHRGVDLAAGAGAVVRAAGPGRVVYAAPLVDRGVVSIEHVGGMRTTYEPVTATVRAGDHVVAGAPVGRLESGHTRCAPGDYLHWGARLPDGTYLDPMALLRPWQVRLKPWDAPS